MTSSLNKTHLYTHKKGHVFFTQCDHCPCCLYLNTMSLRKLTVTLITTGHIHQQNTHYSHNKVITQSLLMNLRLQVCFGKHISRHNHILNISICFRYMNRYALQFTHCLLHSIQTTGGKQPSTHLHLVPRSRTSGDRSSLLPMFLCCEEGNFTLYAADFSLTSH